MDCKDIVLEWNPDNRTVYLIATYISSITLPLSGSTLSSTSILNSNLPSKSNSQVDFSNVAFIKIPIDKVKLTKSCSFSESGQYPLCSGVPFHVANSMSGANNDLNEILVLRSDLVPGEYISSVRRRDWQALLWEVENKMITTAAIACSKASHLIVKELKAKSTEEIKQYHNEFRQQTLTDSLLTEETVLIREHSKKVIDVTLPTTAPSSLLDLVVSKAGISTPLEGRRSRSGTRSGGKKPSVISNNEY